MPAAANGASATICCDQSHSSMDVVRSAWARITAYAEHEDSRTASANLIALVVASNQPFYILYLYALIGGGEKLAPSFLTLLSTPFFLAVPFASRRSSIAGRALLVLTGIGNAIVSTKAFGVEAGIGMFLIPCALIAAALFKPRERLLGFLLIGLCGVVHFAFADLYGAPLANYTASDFAAMSSLNAVSATTLVIFVGLLMSSALADADGRRG